MFLGQRQINYFFFLIFSVELNIDNIYYLDICNCIIVSDSKMKMDSCNGIKILGDIYVFV